ncbi:MAG: class I SAM-dependent methyltransferase [Pyrinomonadaceae bacterium]
MRLPIDKARLKRAALEIHKVGLRLGVQIVPSHYYSSVPNIVELQRTLDVWANRSVMPGVSIDLAKQSQTLRSICAPYTCEYEGNKVYLKAVAQKRGPGYGYIEAQCLHAVVRNFKPRIVIEVGSGVSSHCIVSALALNAEEIGTAGRLVSIEPHPSNGLEELYEVELIQRHVQSVPLELFEKLEKGDLLFIDSSHTVKPGGDVNFLILEVLPRLRPGVIVHFHDIYFPYDYPRDTLRTYLHGMETSLLRAFLMFNTKVEILFCLSLLHYDRPHMLKEVFPEYVHQEDQRGLQLASYKPFQSIEAHFPSSIYLEIH